MSAQLSRADLKQLTSEEITAARAAGQLGDILAGRNPPNALPPHHGVPQLTRTDLATMTAEQIVAARRAGKLVALLSGQTPTGTS